MSETCCALLAVEGSPCEHEDMQALVQQWWEEQVQYHESRIQLYKLLPKCIGKDAKLVTNLVEGGHHSECFMKFMKTVYYFNTAVPYSDMG